MSGKYEPSIISSHILQSAFLAEEREHQDEEDWQTQNLATRAKNVLQRVQEQNVPHAILSGHEAYSSPRQHATSLEAKRLVDKAQSKQLNIIRVLYHTESFLLVLFTGMCLLLIPFVSHPSCIFELFFITLSLSISLVGLVVAIIFTMRGIRRFSKVVNLSYFRRLCRFFTCGIVSIVFTFSVTTALYYLGFKHFVSNFTL